MIKAVTCVSVFHSVEKVAEVKKTHKKLKREKMRCCGFSTENRTPICLKVSKKKQTKTKQPSNIHLKVRTIIRN